MTLEGKYRIRKAEMSNVTDTKVHFYGLYNSRWDALRACLDKARRVAIDENMGGLYAIPDKESGEIMGYRIDTGNTYGLVVEFLVTEAH